MENTTTYKFFNSGYMRYPLLVAMNCKIVGKDFGGKVTRYNKDGNKSFLLVFTDHDFARKLIEDGWNVKQFKPKPRADNDSERADNNSELDYFMNVAVSYKIFPPEIGIVNEDGTIAQLDESGIKVLDRSNISSADVSITQSHWIDDDGKECIKGYLRKLHVRLAPGKDEFSDD